MGWFTVAAYAVGAVLAALAGRQPVNNCGLHEQRDKRRLWVAVAVAMACLCINKQLDLQSLLTDLGRVIARHQGWYERRRDFQKLFVLAALAGAGAFACWFVWRFREFWTRHKLLAAGSLFLLTFILIRAISFHHVDSMLGKRVFGFKINWALELTGIFLVSLAAVREGAGKSTVIRRIAFRK